MKKIKVSAQELLEFWKKEEKYRQSTPSIYALEMFAGWIDRSSDGKKFTIKIKGDEEKDKSTKPSKSR